MDAQKQWGFAALLLALQVSSNAKPAPPGNHFPPGCTPNEEYFEQCNKCWCLKKGIPLCTNLPCKDIPKKDWGKPLNEVC